MYHDNPMSYLYQAKHKCLITKVERIFPRTRGIEGLNNYLLYTDKMIFRRL